jgi:hypothetical protein
MSNDLINVDEELKRRAEALKKNLGSQSVHISTKDKKFNLPNGVILDKLSCVVLDMRFWNKYYLKPWEPNVIATPECFAYGEDERSLIPSDGSPDKQADSCATCPHNIFPPNGGAKACKNFLIMAIMVPDLSDTTVYTLSGSPTSLNNDKVRKLEGLKTYFKKITDVYGHPIKAVTEFNLIDGKRGFKLHASFAGENGNYAEHAAYFDQAEKAITTEPSPPDENTVTEVSAPVRPRSRATA